MKDLIFALQLATKAIIGAETDDDAALDFLENVTKKIRRRWPKE
jgi:hypothetical protein